MFYYIMCYNACNIMVLMLKLALHVQIETDVVILALALLCSETYAYCFHQCDFSRAVWMC